MDLVLADIRMTEWTHSKANDLQACDLIEMTIICHFMLLKMMMPNVLTHSHNNILNN